MENGEQEHAEEAQPTYAEAFPPLMRAGSPPKVSSPHSAWPVKPIRSSTMTQVFHVPLEERRYQFEEVSFGGETRQSEIVREIQEKTGCDIEMTQTKDKGLTIIVTGRQTSVATARRDLLIKLQTQAHFDLKIPKEHHRFVIGRQGEKLKTIELQTATKISVPRSEDQSDIVKIVGTKEGVDKARHIVQTISDEQAKLAFERLDISKDYHPFISGPNGATAKRIMEETGARINIPPLSLMKNEMSVAGDKDGVAKAVAEIQKIHATVKRTMSSVSVEVRKSQHKYIVGPRGGGLQEILGNCGVWVEVPSAETDSNTITLRGPQEKLGQALTQVYEKANSVVTEEVYAPRWLHRFIIGRKGQNVQMITKDLPKVHVEFNSDSDKIVLEGPPTEVQQAKESFESFTEDLMATMDYAEIKVDQKYHRHVIGKGGASVNRIKTETGTSIIIPPDNEHNDVIRIEGDPKGVAAAKAMLLELATKMENERSKDILIDQRFHKQIIGSKGEKIREIRDRFNGIQVSFPEPGEKKDIVTLRGPKQDVEKCAVHLKKMVADLTAANYQEEVRVFKQFHGNIIGKGGNTLRKIREDTETRIDLPTESSSSDVIVITGRKENVQKAKDRIREIEREMALVVDTTVSIPHQLHNAIIGPKGKLVRAVMEECGGVRITFPPSDSKEDAIKLHGPKEDVEKAQRMLQELADEQAQLKHTLEIKCKPEYHRFLIGRGGANIRKVRDQFGARVIFPHKDSEDDPETITIIGKKEKTEAAREHLQKLIKELDNIVEVEMQVNQKYHKHFVQRRGQVIQDIAAENGGVIISFPRSGTTSDKVVLKGAKQCIEGARTRILEVVADLEAQVTIKCEIDSKVHRSILGQRGAHVQAITSEHNVSIKFPDREPQLKSQTSEEGEESGAQAPPPRTTDATRNLILITGRKENCEAAKQALMELIPIEVEVSIPYEFHRYIIGQHGKEVRSLMKECSVNITVPPSDQQSDVIIVSGPAKNCEEAKHALKRKQRELEAEKEERELRNFRVTMSVNPKYHPNIIGKKGAKINKIRESHDVRIQLPERDGSAMDEITIMGYEHQVKGAEADILKIVQELEEQIIDEVEIDRRVHSRLIGVKGKNISKVMDRFNVDIRFPKDKGSGVVVIQGLEENVEDAKEHLITLAEDYMQDVFERDEEIQLMRQYTRPQAMSGGQSRSNASTGFVVRDAPWSGPSAEEFPSLGSKNSTGAKPPANPPAAAPQKTSWGPMQQKPKWGPSVLGPKIPPK
jgi:predicted PilT family ATPase